MSAHSFLELADPLGGYGFTRAFLKGSPEIEPLLGTFPIEEEEPGQVLSRFTPWSAEEVSELAGFNLSVGNRRGAKLAELLSSPDTLAVVTGQQPNLLASPLYIVLKALSACSLARRLSLAHPSRRVVPIFWVASDDHDLAELRDCWVMGSGSRLENLGDILAKKLRVPPASPAYEWPLAQLAPQLLQALGRLLPQTPQAAQTLEIAREALGQAPANFESVFCRMLLAFLGTEEIILLPARLRALRRRQREVLRADILCGEQSARCLQERAAMFEKAGFPPLLHRDTHVLNAFYLDGGMRARLERTSPQGAIIAKNPVSGEVLRRFASQEELLQCLEKEPERFSPNVVTRPLVQDTSLPVAAYVGGPGEIAYLVQLRCVYELHGVRPSRLVPRAFATLLDARTRSELRSSGGVELDLNASPEQVREALLRQAPQTGELLARVQQLEQIVGSQLGALRSLDSARHPHVEVALAKTSRTIQRGLERLRQRLVRRLDLDNSPVSAAYARLLALLTPLGCAQERLLSPLSFCDQLPPEALGQQLRSKLNFEDPWPQVVQLE